MDVPDIYVFVHQQHSHTVAGIQKCLRTWVMCGTDCVVSVFLENTHLSLFCFWICTCAKHAIVVVEACSAKDYALSVNGHTHLRIPYQFTDSEGFGYLIFTKYCFAGVEVRVLRIPKLCVWNIQQKDCLIFFCRLFASCRCIFCFIILCSYCFTFSNRSQDSFSLKFNFKRNLTWRGGLYCNFDLCQIIA